LDGSKTRKILAGARGIKTHATKGFVGLKRRLFAGKTINNRFEFRAGISAMPQSRRFFFKILY
jgi:hypothetical protein